MHLHTMVAECVQFFVFECALRRHVNTINVCRQSMPHVLDASNATMCNGAATLPMLHSAARQAIEYEDLTAIIKSHG